VHDDEISALVESGGERGRDVGHLQDDFGGFDFRNFKNIFIKGENGSVSIGEGLQLVPLSGRGCVGPAHVE